MNGGKKFVTNFITDINACLKKYFLPLAYKFELRTCKFYNFCFE